MYIVVHCVIDRKQSNATAAVIMEPLKVQSTVYFTCTGTVNYV